MATTLGILLVFISFFSFLSIVESEDVPGDINWWCSKTPYPEDCKYFMRNAPPSFVSTRKYDFLKMAVQVTMEQALHAQSHTLSLGPKCNNKREKAAWNDCLELYQNTILQLNRTIQPNSSWTDSDAQTWLSAALTNLETCRAGFVELGLSKFMLPFLSTNVSRLISNTLAINKVPQEENGDGFPRWLSNSDRKLLQSSSTRANYVVARDGTGNFRTIKAAVDAAARWRKGSKRFVIYVKTGIYRENVEIGNTMINIMLVGDGMRKTIITGSRSVGKGTTTFTSATVGAMGEGFIARGITFRNTAGPRSQAVAFRGGSDHSAFYRCAFQGYQDTLYVHSQRQFYKECYIYGTIDFIFGNAAVVFDNCMIFARRPLNGQANVITAQGRIDPNQNTGIVIYKSRIMAAADLWPVLRSVKTFLGRPWKQYSRTVVLETYLDRLVDPAGWSEWGGNFALNTLYYGEYKNTGPASSTRWRVKWRGFHVITRPSEASRFTAGNFIAGGSWLPATGVPFTSEL